MNMSLISSIAIGLLLGFGFFNGLRRGGIREGAALIGVLLGALLVEFWAERWGQQLSQRSGLKIENARWLVGLGLLLGTALLSGYGSGLLIRRHTIKNGERLGGALLGLLNFALLTAFSLRYTQSFLYNEFDPTQPVESWIRSGLVSERMLAWIDVVLAGAALTLAVIAILTLALRLGRLVTQPRPAPKPSRPAQPQGDARPKPQPTQPAPAGPAPDAKPKPVGQQESFMERPPRGP